MGGWCVDLAPGARPSLCPAAIGRNHHDEDSAMNDTNDTNVTLPAKAAGN
jgi:hypothetical protein